MASTSSIEARNAARSARRKYGLHTTTSRDRSRLVRLIAYPVMLCFECCRHTERLPPSRTLAVIRADRSLASAASARGNSHTVLTIERLAELLCQAAELPLQALNHSLERLQAGSQRRACRRRRIFWC